MECLGQRPHTPGRVPLDRVGQCLHPGGDVEPGCSSAHITSASTTATIGIEVARHRAKQPRKDDAIERLVETMGAKATTDPGYLELDVWFDGPHQKDIAAREAAKHRLAKRRAKGLRKPATIELRPAAVQHPYRYQLHRREPAS